jgi:hypothetical protein
MGHPARDVCRRDRSHEHQAATTQDAEGFGDRCMCIAELMEDADPAVVQRRGSADLGGGSAEVADERADVVDQQLRGL